MLQIQMKNTGLRIIFAFLFFGTTGYGLWAMNNKFPAPNSQLTSRNSESSIASDNTLRFYRLALPISASAFLEDFEADYARVQAFWQECEVMVNRAFVPLGLCFKVVADERLVMQERCLIDEDVFNATGYGTELTDAAIGSEAYDVGMWVAHRTDADENTGLSVAGGAFRSSTKSSGYAKADEWVVAHEIGHLFGAQHTTTGEGSLMDDRGWFFSYPSIKQIRQEVVQHGTNGVWRAVKVENSTPLFDAERMRQTYRLPQGACMALPIAGNDAEGHRLTYAAIGCSSKSVENIVEGGAEPHFASLAPGEDDVIDYRPRFSADVFYDDFFYVQSGTDLPSMSAGTYDLALLMNDVPAEPTFEAIWDAPFYSQYAVWDAQVEIVGGTPFTTNISPERTTYEAGERIKITWGVNRNYFKANSRLRITLSTDYGTTFEHVLAESVSALDGACEVVLPHVNVGNVDVDFVTATRSMRGGIVRVEEIGGIAYTLTCLTPERGGGFLITGGEGPTSIEHTKSLTPSRDQFDLQGRRFKSISHPGLYIVGGKVVIK